MEFTKWRIDNVERRERSRLGVSNLGLRLRTASPTHIRTPSLVRAGSTSPRQQTTPSGLDLFRGDHRARVVHRTPPSFVVGLSFERYFTTLVPSDRRPSLPLTAGF